MNIDEDETISVDDDSDDEGPHSWPGTASRPSPVPSESFLKSISHHPITHIPAIQPFTNGTTLTPLILKAPPVPTHLPIPTLYTVLPSGLAPVTNPLRNRFLSRSQPATAISPLSNIESPLVSSTVMEAVPSVSKIQGSISSVLPKLSGPMPTVVAVSSSTQSKPAQQQPISVNNINNNSKCATTLAAIPSEEMTPAYLELKEFAETFKTKRIQLGYTQGAVGQSLANRGYSNFAQSTISRFEQMQLSPSNAANIKPVLERWLHDTENPEAVSSTTLDPLGPPRKRKKRAVFSTQTRNTLEEYFRKEARPNRQIIEAIASELDLLPEEVRVWFCNKRQKYKVAEDIVADGNNSVKSPISPVDKYSISNSVPRTKFTIEELSKSSTITHNTFSPVSFTTVSPQLPGLRPLMFSSGDRVAIASSPFSFNTLSTKA